MDWLVRMNEVLDYIEDHLTQDIDYQMIQRLSLTSGDFFQRMFSNFTGISLGEYIRKRRLSDAAIKLSNDDASVIEVAIAYGYESSDAFSQAFKKIHGVSPSDVKKKEKILTIYPKLSFQITLKGKDCMKYRIVEKKAFQVLGKSIKTSSEKNMNLQEIPKFWTAFNQSDLSEKLYEFSIEQSVLGVCYDGQPDGSFSYMIGVVSSCDENAYEKITIPQATWAVFESRGAMPHSIQKVWADVFQNFLPTSGYEHAPMADFELYPAGDINSDDYYCEVWIPIIKK